MKKLTSPLYFLDGPVAVGECRVGGDPTMDQVASLKASFLANGGSAEAFENLGRGQLGLGDGQLQDGCLKPREARDLAQRCFLPDSLVEIHCYNSRGRSQGEEVLVFEKWLSKTNLSFRASHLVASNDYYEWWASHEANFGRTVFHVCESARHRCPYRGPAGEDVIHITRWRMASPQSLIGSGYASSKALEYFERILEVHLASRGGDDRLHGRGVDPPFPPPTAGPVMTTGLDGAALDVEDAEKDDVAVDNLLDLAAAAKKGKKPAADRGARPPKTKGLGQVLAEKAQSLEDEKKARRRSGPLGGPHGDDDRPSRSKRRRRDRSDSMDCSSGSEKDFRVASSREVDLMALSQRDPGCLLRSALREMKKYLAARGEANKEDLTTGRVVSYLHQILMPQYPKAGLRSQRELVTLATGLDMLLEGDLGRLGDLLVQRFKAIEASLSADGNWSVARHQELIPTQASLSTKAELTEAAKAELRASKLRQQLHKGGKSG